VGGGGEGIAQEGDPRDAVRLLQLVLVIDEPEAVDVDPARLAMFGPPVELLARHVPPAHERVGDALDLHPRDQVRPHPARDPFGGEQADRQGEEGDADVDQHRFPSRAFWGALHRRGL